MDDDGSGGEFGRFINVCFTIFASLTYCYFISKNIPKGFQRLISVLPIISIFTFLPLNLSSLHLSFLVGFLIGWLANFKLLLFSFDHGPLSISNQYSPSSSSSSSSKYIPMTLPLFISLACLPIKIKMINQNPSSSHHDHDLDHHGNSSTKSLRYYVIEGLLLVMLLCVYNFKTLLHYPSLVMKFLYYFQMYFSLELLLVLGAGLAKMMFGLEVEPQFDNLSLSTSTQNFWGRRWNLVSSSILRSTIYDPVRRICSSTCIIGKSLGLYVAVVATFVVSGIMHELLFYYIGRIWPVWDVFWFFALSGICLSVEIAVKKALKGRWQLNQLISRPLTLGFIVVTAFWLLFPVFERIGVDIRVNQELAIFGQFVKGGSE